MCNVFVERYCCSVLMGGTREAELVDKFRKIAEKADFAVQAY